MKKFLIFQEMEFSSPKLLIFSIKKCFSYFRKELAKPEKQKITADLICMPNVSNNKFLRF